MDPFEIPEQAAGVDRVDEALLSTLTLCQVPRTLMSKEKPSSVKLSSDLYMYHTPHPH